MGQADQSDQQDNPQSIARYAIPLIVALFYFTTTLHTYYTPDDTFIYLRFAKNIASGNGFAFNPSQPTYGVTSPLWTLLISAAVSLHLNPFTAAKVLDLVLASAAILLSFFYARDILGDKISALVAGFILSMNVWIIRWTGTGMESSLALLLAIATLQAAHRQERLLSVIFCGLLTLVRPEAMILFVLLSIQFFLTSPRTARTIEHSIVRTIVYAMILTPWIIFAYTAFSSVLPNPMLAKSGLIDPWGARWWALKSSVLLLSASDGFSILMIIALVVVLIRSASWDWLAGNIAGLLWIVLLPAGYIVLGVDVTSRYLVLISPMLAVYGVAGFLILQSRFAVLQRYGYTALFVFAALILIQNQIVYQKSVIPHMNNFSAGMKSAVAPIGKWLSVATPANAIIVTPDAGAIGYYSDRTIVDLAGLVSPAMLRFRERGITTEDIIKNGLYRQVVKPNYVVDRNPVQNRLQSDSLRPIFSKPFPGLSLRDPSTQYYTLYEVVK